MCLKSVAVTGTPLLFNNTLSVRLELGYCPTVTIFPENCAHSVNFKIHKRPLSFVVVLRGGSIQVIQMSSLFSFAKL